MPEIFKWKLIGRYVCGSPLLDITAYFRASLEVVVKSFITTNGRVLYKLEAGIIDQSNTALH